MDHAEFDKMFEVEETNWWYRGRRALVTPWIECHHQAHGSLRILDIASATGISFRMFGKYGAVHGLDISDETIRLCHQRGVRGLVQGDAERLPFRDNSFDVVMALDALEHFRDDHAAMAEIYRVARPHALVLITVPAFMFLWSPHDEAYHHMRRYTRGELSSKLQQHQFQLHKISYYSMTLMPPVFVMRKWRSILQKKEETAHSDFFLSLPRPVEAMLYGIMRTEIGMMNAVNLPFGVSLFCAATPGDKLVTAPAPCPAPNQLAST